MQPKIFLADEHDIDSSKIDADALQVIERLQQAGHEAYLVGGGVRDLLAKKRPKDFDVSTSAKPEEVKAIFRRQCLLIGRRFRLAHVRFGKNVIEVSTFRAGEDGDELIVRDNEWGTAQEDALRRDFTINGLFYDPSEHHIIDYVGGWEDIHRGCLHTIGQPAVRFRQDPVRMIRLLKFRARFGYSASEETEAAMIKCREEIVKSSPARILEEMLRMLESGSSEPFFRLLDQYQFTEQLFPWLRHFLEGPHGESIYTLLRAADVLNHRRSKHQPLDRSVLLTCLLFPLLDRELHDQFLSKNRIPHLGDIAALTSNLTRAVASTSFSQFPRRLRVESSFILSTQYRLTPLTSRKYYRTKLPRHPEFLKALEFLRLRAHEDESLAESLTEWEEVVSEQPVTHRSAEETKTRPRRRRKGRKGGAPRGRSAP